MSKLASRDPTVLIADEPAQISASSQVGERLHQLGPLSVALLRCKLDRAERVDVLFLVSDLHRLAARLRPLLEHLLANAVCCVAAIGDEAHTLLLLDDEGRYRGHVTANSEFSNQSVGGASAESAWA
jgi:hypothetical protein